MYYVIINCFIYKGVEVHLSCEAVQIEVKLLKILTMYLNNELQNI